MYNSLVNPVKAAIKYLGGAGSDILEWCSDTILSIISQSTTFMIALIIITVYIIFECKARTCRKKVENNICSLATNISCRSKTNLVFRKGHSQIVSLFHDSRAVDWTHIQNIFIEWSIWSEAFKIRKSDFSQIIWYLLWYQRIQIATEGLWSNARIFSEDPEQFIKYSWKTGAI
jgi:hypothetical protein